MEWLSPPLDTPTDSHALHRLSFDLIRASITARQSASATCRALASAHAPAQAKAESATSTVANTAASAPALHLLSGTAQGTAQQRAPAGGSFAALFSTRQSDEAPCSPYPGLPPGREGQSDA